MLDRHLNLLKVKGVVKEYMKKCLLFQIKVMFIYFCRTVAADLKKRLKMASFFLKKDNNQRNP